MKKKLFAFLLALSMIFSLAACSSQAAGAENADDSASTETPAQTDVSKEAYPPEENKAIGEQPAANIGNSDPVVLQEVELSPGTLVGYKEGNVYNFKGIPYATAERFQNPVPVIEYDGGTRMALAYGEVSPQSRTLTSEGEVNIVEILTPSNGTADMVGNETCQFLNVWTTDLTAKKPVIVFFHGGGLSSGASSELSTYTGEYFVDSEDAVFVSVNHRLNLLGFLDLSEYGEEYANSGLAGIRDCVVALQWVQDNIASFGGDPDDVTILGQSGGGNKVATLACMSDTVDLFQNVISLSGYYVWNPKETALDNTQLLIDYLNLSEDEVVPALTSMSYEELYNASTAAGCSWDYASYGTSTFETPLFDENGNMNEYAKQRNWMVGTVYGESGGSNGIWLTIANTSDSRLDWIDDQTTAERLETMYGDAAPQVIEAYQSAYPDHPLAESLFISTGTGMISRGELIVDNGILESFNNAGVDVYNYVAAYTMPFFGGITMYHTGDMAFWFNSLDTVKYMIKGDEENAYRVAQQMADSICAFAATGNPSTAELPWDAYSADTHNTMVFDVNSECKTDFDTAFYDLVLNTQDE